MNSGGTITVTLKLDNSQFLAASAASQGVGKEVDQNLSNSADNAEAHFNQAGFFIRGTLLAIGAAAAATAVASVHMAADFQQSLNILQSVSGATSGQLAQLAAKARELGNDVTLPGISAKDAAAAMTELAKAGVGVNDVLSASKGVLSLAKAGQLDVADAATITARTLNAFGLAGEKATLVADALAAGANASTADVTDMAFALSQAGASAARMGLSVGDTVTTLGLFSNAGINGSDAGTSLKTALQRLAAPTDDAASAMKNLGLKFFDAKGNFVGIRDAAGQLQDKLGKLTQEQREQALATIFGTDASRAAGVLAAQGATGFDKMALAVNKQGAATDLAKAQNSGFKGALDNLQSTAETLATDLGTKLLPGLTGFATLLSNHLKPVLAVLVPTVASLAVALTAVILPAGFFAAIMAAIFSPVTAVIFGIAALAAGLVYLQGKFGFVTKSLDLIKTGFSNFLDIIKPVTDFVGKTLADAFASLVSIGKQLGETFKPIIDAFQKILANKVVQDVLKGIGIALLALAAAPVVIFFGILIGTLKVLQVALGFIADHFEIIKKVVLVIIAVALSPLIAAVLLAIGIFKLLVATVKIVAAVFTAVFNAIATVIGFVFGLISTLWNTILKPVFDAIVFVITALATIWFTIWSGIFQVVFTIVSTLAQILFVIFQGIFNFIVNTILTPIYNFFAGVFGAIYSFVAGVVSAIYNVIATVFGAIFSFVVGIFSAVYNFVAGIFSAIYNTIAGIVSSIYNYVSGVFNNVKDAVVGAVKGAIKGISNFAKDFIDAGKNIIDGIVQGIGNAKDAVVNKIKDICKGALDAVKSFFGIHSPSTVMAGIGDNLMGGLAKGINRTGSAAVGAVNGVSQSILGTVNGLTSNGLGSLDVSGGVGVAGGAAVVQNNNIYNQVDLDVVTRELAWQIRR